MLKTLQIKNVALITELEIEFSRGLNVLTGETGAGKSIIIGSLNLILGAKLDKSAIRQGATSARVDAVFQTQGVVAKAVTDLCGVEISDNSVVLSRVLKSDGKGECRVNGLVVALDTLRAVANLLINIHGQHDTEVLLKPKNHVDILDSFGGGKVRVAKKEYNDEVAVLNEYKKTIKSFGGDDFERKRLVDMYEYQIRDIEGAKLVEDEDVVLAEKKTRMQNFEKLSNTLGTTAAVFEGDDGIGVQMRGVVSALGGIANLDPRAEKYFERARSLKMELDDLGGDIQNYYDNLEFDPEEFRRVDSRLDEIKILKRKYGSTIAEIFAFLNETRVSYDHLTRSEEDIEKIKQKIAAQEVVVGEHARKLVEAREAAAVVMSEKIVAHLKDLGMPSAKFEVADIGVDGVNFMFSANAGQNTKPLASIISGGEMSRFMLALKAATANIDCVGTMVFDEIDTGISGLMGHAIAAKMGAICQFSQIIAVTHLAQIASCAASHFLIRKDEVGGKTSTSVSKLSSAQSKAELARMLGGEDFAKQVLK